ncbi:Lysophospholipid acyltransferase LPEAT2 [Linum grandiflorum]
MKLSNYQYTTNREVHHFIDKRSSSLYRLECLSKSSILPPSNSLASVPPPSTVDPFRNGTPNIDGFYEVLKILLLRPIILLSLLLFGLCLAVGFLASKLAIHGWKDKGNPMPRWRSRLMWITRFSARGILFSFGFL